MKKMISIMCEFDHEKTGIWFDISKNYDSMDKYGKEFWNQYPRNEIPESILEFFK
jgi:hypothetical protein